MDFVLCLIVAASWTAFVVWVTRPKTPDYKAEDPDYVVHRFRLRRDADDLYDMLTEWRTKS